MHTAFKCDISPSTRAIIDRGVNMQMEAMRFRYSDQDKYRDILNRLYQDEFKRRHQNWVRIKEGGDAAIDALQRHISKREYIVDTLVDWICLPEPRNAPLGILTTIPWIPFYRQIDLIEWIFDHYLRGEGGLVEKSREEGVSFICCLIGLHEWRWTYGFRGGFGSNLLASVDDKDNSKSLFEKIRWMINTLPAWWLPRNFRWRQHSKTGHLKNPEMDSALIGEGGEGIGRGDRTAIYFVDEKAFVEHQDQVEKNLGGGTTMCQMDISSANGTNEFYEKKTSGRVDVFTFSYKDDPRKTGEWVEHERKRLDKITFAQEVEISYLSSVSDLLINEEWFDAACDIKLEAAGICESGMDVGAGGKDDSALATRTGPVLHMLEEIDESNGTNLTHRAIDKWNANGTHIAHYDQNAVGHAVKSALESTEAKINFKIYGIFGQGSCSEREYDEFDRDAKSVFLNNRAEIHWLLARRFEKTWEHVNKIRSYPEDELICISPKIKDMWTKLKAETCSPKMEYTTSGKRRVESKDDMRSRGIKSPNLFESVVYAFAPADGGHQHIVDDFDPADFKMTWNPKDRELYRGLPLNLHYGAVCILENMKTNCMCAVWNQHYGHLYIYDEVTRHKVNPETVCQELAEKMHLKTFEVDKIFGNDEMFKKERLSMAKVFNKELSKIMYSSELKDELEVVKIKPARRYDPAGSILLLNHLSTQRRITVHKRCKEVLRQLTNWRTEKGKIKKSGMQEAILLILSDVKRQVDVREIMKDREYKTIVNGKPQQQGPVRPDPKILQRGKIK